MFVLIDNYDSFTYNLYHFLGELGARIEVRRNDKVSVAEVMAMTPQGIILSPGPGYPDSAGQPNVCLADENAAFGTMPGLPGGQAEHPKARAHHGHGDPPPIHGVQILL